MIAILVLAVFVLAFANLIRQAVAEPRLRAKLVLVSASYVAYFATSFFAVLTFVAYPVGNVIAVPVMGLAVLGVLFAAGSFVANGRKTTVSFALMAALLLGLNVILGTVVAVSIPVTVALASYPEKQAALAAYRQGAERR